jgi:hypothetical protein
MFYDAGNGIYGPKRWYYINNGASFKKAFNLAMEDRRKLEVKNNLL